MAHMKDPSPPNNQESPPFKTYISPTATIPEGSTKAIVLGCIIALVFGLANAYLGLKVGMTVSASIPAAVMSMAILRSLYKKTGVTVLENNMVQTAGSAGEAVAGGVVFTIPAFFIWASDPDMIAQGYSLTISKPQVFWFAMLGGTLGILFMIPLRKYLVEKEHGKLMFPEGTACAEIIIAGDEGGSRAKTVFTGVGLGAIFKSLMTLCRFWSESPSYNLRGLMKGGIVGMDTTPALLGVGYIIGPRIAALMLSGAVIGYLGISPLLSFIGSQVPGLIIAPGTIPLSDMTPGDLRNFYIKYLGVGAVAFGGTVSLIKAMPTIVSSFSAGFSQLLRGSKAKTADVIRTDRDLPMSVILIGSAIIILAIWLMPGIHLNLLGAALSVLFGFFFVVVSARIVGLVGSSSSPVSGMTIFTLLVTCLILLWFGVTGVRGMITAMSVGTVVCIAVCLSGDIAQDLKTGYLLGATPMKQQIMMFIGMILPALAMGFTVYLLGDSFGFVRSAEHPTPLLAPQANVMATVVKGVISHNIPWTPILVGAMIALGAELLGAPALPFAIGLYLPLSLSTPIMVGGMIAMLVAKLTKEARQQKLREETGILFASGLVAGDALIGIFSAGLIAWLPGYQAFYNKYEVESFLTGSFGPWLALICFFLLASVFFTWSMKKAGK